MTKKLLIGNRTMHEERKVKRVVQRLLKGMRPLQNCGSGVHGQDEEREVGILALRQKNQKAEDINMADELAAWERATIEGSSGAFVFLPFGPREPQFSPS